MLPSGTIINILILVVVIIVGYLVVREMGSLRQRVRVQEAKVRKMKQEMMHGIIQSDMTNVGFNHRIEPPPTFFNGGGLGNYQQFNHLSKEVSFDNGFEQDYEDIEKSAENQNTEDIVDTVDIDKAILDAVNKEALVDEEDVLEDIEVDAVVYIDKEDVLEDIEADAVMDKDVLDKEESDVVYKDVQYGVDKEILDVDKEVLDSVNKEMPDAVNKEVLVDTEVSDIVEKEVLDVEKASFEDIDYIIEKTDIGNLFEDSVQESEPMELNFKKRPKLRLQFKKKDEEINMKL